MSIDSRSHLCGLDLNLTYPQTGGKFPTLNLTIGPGFGGERVVSNTQRRLKTNAVTESLKAGLFDSKRRDEHTERRMTKRDAWKRDLSNLPNGTVDPWYGCDIYDEMIDYALNFSIPWSAYTSYYPLSFRHAKSDICFMCRGKYVRWI